MKKLLLALIILGYSQAEAQVKFRGGIKAGYAASTINNLDADYRNGLYAGVYGDLNLARVYSMQFEMLYLQQGVSNLHTYQENNLAPQTFNVNRNYLSLNLLNKFSFNKISMFVGPGLDIKISDNSNSLRNYRDQQGYYSLPYENNSDVDLTINIGVAFKINNNISIEGRLRQGIIEQVYVNSNYYNDSNLNKSFLIGLNYTFD